MITFTEKKIEELNKEISRLKNRNQRECRRIRRFY